MKATRTPRLGLEASTRLLATLTLAALIAMEPFDSVLAFGVQDRSNSATAQQPAPTPQAETLDSLRARIAGHISQQRFASATWGIKVVSLDSGKAIFEQNPGKYFNPASNAKLYSAALALDRLGGDYRIKTSLFSTTRPDAVGTIKSDLIVYGRGDPTLAARLNEGDYYKPFETLIAALVNAGVRRIEGDLVGDESHFAGPPFGSGWEWDDLQWYYGAEVSALSVNDNSVDLFVKPADRPGLPCRITTGPSTSFVTLMNRTQTVAKGSEARMAVYRPVGENIIYVSGRLAVGERGYSGSVAVHNPAGLFVTLFKDALARRGIVVTGRTRSIDWKYREVTPIVLSRLIELGSVESPPLSDIVRETLKPSQNLYAQLLLLQVGAGERDAATRGRGDAETRGKGDDESRGAEGQRESATRGRGDAETQGKSDASTSASSSSVDSFQTTEELGIRALSDFLASVGINQGDVLLEEGSGLSRRDIVTPTATVELLRFMDKHRWADAYRNALPVAGVDGTLQNRMRGTPAAANARAKTGSFRYVNALSGYVTTAAGERLAFSIMLNNYYSPEPSVSAPRESTSSRSSQRAASPSARDDIDTIVVILATFTGRS